MTQQQTEQAINSLCLIGHFGTLYRVIKFLPGSKAILISDRPAEEKRCELLLLLKKTQATGAGPVVSIK